MIHSCGSSQLAVEICWTFVLQKTVFTTDIIHAVGYMRSTDKVNRIIWAMSQITQNNDWILFVGFRQRCWSEWERQTAEREIIYLRVITQRLHLLLGFVPRELGCIFYLLELLSELKTQDRERKRKRRDAETAAMIHDNTSWNVITQWSWSLKKLWEVMEPIMWW